MTKKDKREILEFTIGLLLLVVFSLVCLFLEKQLTK